jgi:hypothetical protein
MDIQNDADLPRGSAGREIARTGTPLGICEALADPIVQALMRADHIDAQDVESLMRRTAARLARMQGRGDANAGSLSDSVPAETREISRNCSRP